MAIEGVTVLDLEEATRLAGDPRTAMISVTDPGIRAPLHSGFHEVLRLAFHDVGEDLPPGMADLIGLPEGEIEPFREDQARRLVAWADALAVAPDRLHVVVHCHAGVSRSPAIAWFLHQRHRAGLRWEPYFAPNRRVLRLLAWAGNAPADPPQP